MRRLIPTKDAEFVQHLQYGVKAAPFPRNLTVEFDTLFREDVEYMVQNLINNDSINWDDHFIQEPIYWYFYPSNYPGGVEVAFGRDIHVSIGYDDSTFFPETINTKEQLINYLMQGIPEEYVEGVYADEIIYNLLDEEGRDYAYDYDNTSIAENGKSVTATLFATFPAIGVDSLAATEINATSITGETVHDITLAQVRVTTSPSTPTTTYNAGQATITGSKQFANSQIVVFELEFNGGGTMGKRIVLRQTEIIKVGKNVDNIIPVQFINSSSVQVFGLLHLHGTVCAEGSLQPAFTATLYDMSGNTVALGVSGRTLKAYIYYN